MNLFAPECGRIHRLPNILVDESEDWDLLLDRLCPTSRQHDLRKIKESYPARKTSAVAPKDIILLNFGVSIRTMEPARRWGLENNVTIASARTPFAIVETYPNLHREIGVDQMVIASLEDCLLANSRRVVKVWLSGDRAGAGLDWPGYGWDSYCWFVFESV